MSAKTYRRISDAKQNGFVANGVESHKPTSVAPPSLMEALPEAVVRQVTKTQTNLERALSNVVGTPFYSAPGFILYCSDCVPFLSELSKANLPVDLTVTSPPYNIGKEYEFIPHRS